MSTANPLEIGRLLEVSNGEWLIVCTSLSLFLIYHLVRVGSQRRIGWRRWLWNLPLSMQLAVGVLIISLGVGTRSALIWWGRFKYGAPLQGINEWMLLWGTLLAILGFMCVLRVITRPVFGHWPWVATLLAMAGYWLLWYLT